MGHSMGGYLCAQYLKLKQPKLKMLYLLSPAGFTNRSDEEMSGMAQYKTAISQFFRWGFDMVIARKVTPFNFMVFGPKASVKRYFGSGRLKLSAEQADVFTDYFASTLEKRLSGEKALGVLLRYGRYSSVPICDTLAELDKSNKLNTPIKILYGARDWMDVEHSLAANERLNLKIEIQTIPDCDHQIIYQNPDGLAKVLLDDQKQGYEAIHKRFTSDRRRQ